MRASYLVLILTLSILAAGCGIAAPTTLSPDPCRPLAGDTLPARLDALTARYQELVAQLPASLQGTAPARLAATATKLVPCLAVDPISGGGANVYQALLVKGGIPPNRFGALIYQDGSTWRAAALDTGKGTGLVPALATRRGERLEFVASTAEPSGDARGRFQVYQLGADFQLLWESPEYDHFTGHAFSGDLLLARYRDPAAAQESQLFATNMGEDGQTLWARQGDAFTAKASRRFPSPRRAVSVFLGALARGDRATAARWALTDAVVDTAAKAGAALKPRQPPVAESQAIESAEAAYWEALPDSARGAAPAAAKLLWPTDDGRYQLELVRFNGDWRVSKLVKA